MKQFLTWLKSIWSEPDGSGSSTRIHCSALIAFVIACGISLAILVHRKVVTVEQFDAFLGSAATFVSVTCGPLYGLNKLSDWAKSKTQQNGPQQCRSKRSHTA